MNDTKHDSHPEAFHRLLFNQAGMAMVAADRDGHITAWNRAAQRMFGAASEVMVGSHWTSLIPLEEREGASKMLSDCLNHDEVAEFEFSMRDEHGTRQQLAAIVTPIAEVEGKTLGGLACVRDITNRLILRERLAHQTKMAALGEMAGALAHHFNNILGGIVTSVDFALASDNPDVLARVLEQTATALGRPTDLVNNLLAFAEGDFRDASRCEFGEAVIDVVVETEKRLLGSRIQLNIEIDAIPVMSVPRTAAMTMLRNLVENAIESMPEGGELTITLKDKNDHAELRVGDTGSGLDDETISRIFEPFFTTKRTGNDPAFSRGLGLAVAHGILKVLHGAISVSSSEGHGSDFLVTLPYQENDPSRHENHLGTWK
ncbi:MAG: PAS domain S-box protein [Planctomycetes bacterium]|nr:PAS domain S-box protein [Planctomycetota bacterium]